MQILHNPLVREDKGTFNGSSRSCSVRRVHDCIHIYASFSLVLSCALSASWLVTTAITPHEEEQSVLVITLDTKDVVG